MKIIKSKISLFPALIIFTIIIFLPICLTATSERTKTQYSTGSNKTGNINSSSVKNISRTNTNYKPNTAPVQKINYDAGGYSSYPAPINSPPAQQPYSTPPRTTNTTYTPPPNPGAMGCAACITGCFSIMPFAVFIFIFLILRSINKKKANMMQVQNSNYYQQIPAPRNTDFNQSLLYYIKENIYDFNESSFVDRVNSVFYQIQNAKLKRDIQTIRPYVTDGYFNKFKFIINQMIQEHKSYIIKDISVNKISISKFKQEDHINSITVRIDASLTEAVVDEKNPTKIYSGSLTMPRVLSELWIFIRNEDAFSDDSESSLSGKCPVCGAPVRMSNDERCEFCGANLTQNQSDPNWLLSDIKPIS